MFCLFVCHLSTLFCEQRPKAKSAKLTIKNTVYIFMTRTLANANTIAVTEFVITIQIKLGKEARE